MGGLVWFVVRIAVRVVALCPHLPPVGAYSRSFRRCCGGVCVCVCRSTHASCFRRFRLVGFTTLVAAPLSLTTYSCCVLMVASLSTTARAHVRPNHGVLVDYCEDSRPTHFCLRPNDRPPTRLFAMPPQCDPAPSAQGTAGGRALPSRAPSGRASRVCGRDNTRRSHVPGAFFWR